MHGVRKEAQAPEAAAALAAKKAKKLADYVKGRDIVLAKHAQGDYDEEGLGVCEALLRGQPDVGTFWAYRRLALQALAEVEPEDMTKRRLEADLRLTFDALGKNPKSYGAWHHRGWLLARAKEPDWAGELGIIGKALTMDERNFHCWDHRRLVVTLAGIAPEQELAFSKDKVSANFSNYSAWHYRGSLLPSLRPPPPGTHLPLEPAALKEELKLAMNAFYTDPEDQAAWLYTTFLLQESESKGELEILARSYDEERDELLVCLNRVPDNPADVAEITAKWGALSQATVDGSRTSALWSLSQFPPDKEVDKTRWVDAEAVRVQINGNPPPPDIADALQLQLQASQVRPRAANFILGEEGSGLKELIAEEGEGNMWPRYIATLSMLRLNPLHDQFADEILGSLRSLEDADGKRKGYYQALRDRFRIGRAILAQIHSPSLDLSSLVRNVKLDRSWRLMVMSFEDGLSFLAFTDLITVLFRTVRVPADVELEPLPRVTILQS